MTSRLLWEDILETDQEEASDWDDNDGEHMDKQINTFPNEEYIIANFRHLEWWALFKPNP